MNILVICHYGLYQDLTSSFVHNQLREFVAQGNRVRVIIPNGTGKPDRNQKRLSRLLTISKSDGVELYDLRYITLSTYGKKHFNALSAYQSIKLCRRKIFKGFSPDIVHAHTLGLDSELGSKLKKIFSCPLVVTTHGSDTAVPVSKGENGFLRSKADKADVIVSVSNQLSALLASCGTKTEIITIHNGYVPHKLSANIEKDPYGIIQVGHLIESKKNEVTIRAFAQLKKHHPLLNLTIIGTGLLRERLEALCRELGVEDSVTFTGQLPNSEVFEKMCRASYFVMASKPEGFGIVYLEAMAAGCVAVGTKGQGIADIIRPGENGFLVEADDVDAVVSVLDNCLKTPALWHNISESAKNTALEHDWSVNAKKHTELYKSLL